MMFFGSSARLMVRIMSTAPAPASVTRKSILCRPTPCSPVQVPSRLRARGHQRVVQRFGDVALFGRRRGRSGSQSGSCRRPRGRPESTGMPLASASATESSRQSARREIGTQVSVEMARQPGATGWRQSRRCAARSTGGCALRAWWPTQRRCRRNSLAISCTSSACSFTPAGEPWNSISSSGSSRRPSLA